MSSYFKALKSLNTDVLSPAFHELIRSAPDSLFLGTAFFALITQSFPLGIFTLAMTEFGLLHRVLSTFIGSVEPNEKAPTNAMCIPGIPSPYQISLIGKVLGQTAFPSGPIFFISAVISYILSSTHNFVNELKELGRTESEWNARLPLSLTFSILVLCFFLVYRVYYDCEGPLVALGSSVFGLFIGFGVYILHVYLFGRDSINFLGLPLLADRAANGRPLYVCSKQD